MPEQSTGHLALLGLGTMGAQMSRRLVEAGFAVTGFDPRESARAALVGLGGQAALSAAEAVAGADQVILMLPSSAVVEAVLGDPDVLAALKPGVP